ncbi:MAG: TadE/TadG family type IV pilus assembly protein [Chloroflexota bacterium]
MIVRSPGAISPCADPRGAGIGRKVARKVRMPILRDRVGPRGSSLFAHGVTRVIAPPPLDSHRRGQAVVELAIILPLLALLLVMAVDAGRLFFGWVALHNASRIGADYAASNADVWNGPPEGNELDELALYELLVRQDLQALGCQDDPVPAPNFDLDGNGTDDFEDGDLVQVELTCAIGLLTPLAEAFLGSPATIRAHSEFPINRVITSGLPGGGNPPPPLGCDTGEARVPDLVDKRNIEAHELWTDRGFEAANYAPLPVGPNRNRFVTFQWLAAGTCEPLLTAEMRVDL